MLVHLLVSESRFRFLFWPDYQTRFSYSFPLTALSRPEAFPAIFATCLRYLNPQALVAVSDRMGSSKILTTWLAEVTGAGFSPLKSLNSSVEWNFLNPERLSPERELALNGAALLWPTQDLILMHLNQSLHIDVLQEKNHLGGFELMGWEILRDQFFPASHRLLTYEPRKNLLREETYVQQGREMLVQGVMRAWTEHISRQYSPKKEPLLISYGDDAAGFRFFPGVSDYHRLDLIDLGCRELVFQQFQGPTSETTR